MKNMILKDDFNSVFYSVIKEVEKGCTISQAVKKIGINSSTFYRKINKEQKCLLDLYRTSNTKYGAGSRWNITKREI